MFLKRLKENSNKTYIKNRLNDRAVNVRKFKADSLAIVFNYDEFDDISFFETIAKTLEVKNHKFQLIPFTSKTDDVKINNSRCFISKDFGWNGKIINQELKHIINLPVDLLVSYYTTNDIYLKLLSAASSAQLKVGLLEDEINDITIATTLQDTEKFTSELYKYLKTLA